MKFSNKAYKYIDGLNRDKDFTFNDKIVLEKYLISQNIPLFEKIIDHQLEYSGLELTITNEPSSTFHAQLFSKSQIKSNTPIDLIQINGLHYFYCGYHQTAQFEFVISEKGEICTFEPYDNTINIIYSSFEKLIESYAFEDLIRQNNLYEDPSYYELVDPSKLKYLTQNYFHHLTASDDFNQWLSNEEKLIIRKGTWLDRAAFYIHLFGKNEIQFKTFVKLLQKEKIIY